MLKYWLFSLLFLASDATAAAERAFSCNAGTQSTGKTASALSEAVQNNYAAIAAMQASFEQDSYLAALETNEVSSGSVWFKKPGLMRWNYATPEKQVFLIREHTVWYYQETEKQLLIDKIDQMLLSDLPVSFLFGIGNLTRDFEALSVCKSAAGRVLTLRPRNPSSDELKEFELLVDAVSALPRGARVTDASGNVTAIELSQINTAQISEDKIFEPDFPSGIDISDKREQKDE